MDKRELFRYVEAKYPHEHRLVIEGGKLTDEWTNVAGHCFIQAVAHEVIGGLLGLDHESVGRLARVAACHDWKKRLEKRPGDFSEADEARAEQYLAAAAPDKGLMNALNPWFLPLVFQGEASFLQLLQFLVDDMAMNGEFVTFDERVEEAEKRNPDPEPEMRKLLGRPYWKAERDVGHSVERMVFAIFAARRVPIATSRELVEYVNNDLTRRFPT